MAAKMILISVVVTLTELDFTITSLDSYTTVTAVTVITELVIGA